MEQKVILLACAAGMSTSLLVTKMQEVSKKDKIFAIPVSKVDQKVNEVSYQWKIKGVWMGLKY